MNRSPRRRRRAKKLSSRKVADALRDQLRRAWGRCDSLRKDLDAMRASQHGIVAENQRLRDIDRTVWDLYASSAIAGGHSFPRAVALANRFVKHRHKAFDGGQR